MGQGLDAFFFFLKQFAAVVDVRNALAMAHAMELGELEVRRAGLNGVPLDLFLGDEAMLEEAVSLQTRAAALGETALAIPYLARSEVSELLEVLERVAVTGYAVPGGCECPNWLNVKCAMALVDRWMRTVQQRAPEGPDRTTLLAKLRQLSAAAFSSKKLRAPDAAVVVAREREREKQRAVMGPLNVEEDLPSDAQFSTALEIAQDTLRVVLKRFCWLYRVEVIEGDGNCYYRAVVRALTPHVPRDFEDACSLQLRKLVNDERQLTVSSEMKELSEFEVSDESDRKTMAVAGVWADHVQIAKVAAFLGRRIWLLRCDDAELKMDEKGQLAPSELYRIGPESAAAAPPILLYYQASPGHFETLTAASRPSLQELLDGELPDVSLTGLCDCFFRFESAQHQLEEMRAQCRDYAVPYEVRQAVSGELPAAAEVLSKQLATFRGLVGARFWVADVADDKAYPLFGELAEQLADDAKARPGDDSFGPLQQLADRLLMYKPVSTVYGARDMMSMGGMGLGMGMSALGGARAGMSEDYGTDDDAWPVGMYSPTVRRREALSPLPERKPLQFHAAAVTEYVQPSSASKRWVGGDAHDNNSVFGETPAPEPRRARVRRPNVPAESASELLESDDVLLEEWEPLLLTAAKGGIQKVVLEVHGITISPQALRVCFEAIAKLAASKQLKGAVHLQMTSCRLDDDCCCILLKPPRNVSFVALEKCAFNAPMFEVKFKVKQHMAVKT